jgi:hypothetical protein
MGATNVFAKFAGDECLDEGAETTAGQFLDKIAFWTKVAADGAAATATADTFVFTNRTGGSILLLAPTFVGIGAGITADNTNFATLQVKRDDGIGGASVVAWSITTAITDSGNFTASIPKVFTLRSATATNVVVPAGGNVLVAITKSGSGVVVPIGGITIPYRMVG